MKRMALLMSSLLVMVMFVSVLTFAANDIYLDQIGVDFDLAPLNSADLDYLPLKKMAEYYGISYSVNAKKEEIYGKWNRIDFTLNLDSRVSVINKKRVILSRSVVEVNGHLLVPVDFFKELLNINFRWRNTGGTKIIFKQNDFADSVEILLYTNKDEYYFGEQVVINMVIKNTSPYKLEIPMTSSQVYDLWLSYQGYEIWRWSKDKMFMSVITEFELEPNESKIYTFTLPDGLILTPTQYRIQGSLVSKPEVISDLYYFRVK